MRAEFATPEFYAGRGVLFPPGAWVRFDERSGNLLFRNSAANLQQMEEILRSAWSGRLTVGNVEMRLVIVAVPRSVAAACGLLKEASPRTAAVPGAEAVAALVRAWRAQRPAGVSTEPVRAVFGPAAARTMTDTLRRLPGVRILGSTTVLGYNEATAAGGQTVYRKLDPDGAPLDVGLDFSATPVLLPREEVRVEFSAAFSLLVEGPPGDASAAVLPVLATIALGGRYDVSPNSMIVISAGRPVIRGPRAPSAAQAAAHAAFWADQEVLAFLTVNLERFPEEKTTKVAAP